MEPSAPASNIPVFSKNNPSKLPGQKFVLLGILFASLALGLIVFAFYIYIQRTKPALKESAAPAPTADVGKNDLSFTYVVKTAENTHEVYNYDLGTDKSELLFRISGAKEGSFVLQPNKKNLSFIDKTTHNLITTPLMQNPKTQTVPLPEEATFYAYSPDSKIIAFRMPDDIRWVEAGSLTYHSYILDKNLPGEEKARFPGSFVFWSDNSHIIFGTIYNRFLKPNNNPPFMGISYWSLDTNTQKAQKIVDLKDSGMLAQNNNFVAGMMSVLQNQNSLIFENSLAKEKTHQLLIFKDTKFTTLTQIDPGLFFVNSIPSPDGKKLAFSFYNPEQTKDQFYIQTLDLSNGSLGQKINTDNMAIPLLWVDNSKIIAQTKPQSILSPLNISSDRIFLIDLSSNKPEPLGLPKSAKVVY